jgi:secondary thiamine-phosphate synthase enzyme
MSNYYITQKEITLSFKKGCYIITNEILNVISSEVKKIKIGTVNLFLMHTSAAITVLESYDPSVMKDLNNCLDKIVPEGNFYLHTDEGPDDAPSHIKCAMIGPSITIPITEGKINMGTWQGIILCEFRTSLKKRTILATISGMKY